MALVEECYGEGTLKSTAAAAGRSVNALYKSLRRIRAILHDGMLTSRELLADSTNEQVTSLILWYDATSGLASLDLQHSFDFQPPAATPAGWQGAFLFERSALGTCGFSVRIGKEITERNGASPMPLTLSPL